MEMKMQGDVQVATCAYVRRGNPANYCTREAGHGGPHGIELPGGLIVGPWHGGTDGAIQPEVVDLHCDDCSATTMALTRSDDGADFACAQCGQSHWFGKDGQHTSVSVTLWPSKMAPRYQRDVYLPAWRKKFGWSERARLLGGLSSQTEHDKKCAEADAAVEAEHLRLTREMSLVGRWKALVGWFAASVQAKK